MTDCVVALAEWRKVELLVACLSLTVCRCTQQGICNRAEEICTLMSTHELKHNNPRDTN